MTTLILAQKRFLTIRLSGGINRLENLFLEINRGGIASAALLTFIAVAVLGYLFALYVSFEFGFILQEQERVITELQTSVTVGEVKINELRSNMAKYYGSLLSSMEKISDVRYIVEDGFAVSRSEVHP